MPLRSYQRFTVGDKVFWYKVGKSRYTFYSIRSGKSAFSVFHKQGYKVKMNTEVDEEIVNKIIKMVKTNEFEGGKTPEQKLMDRGVVIAELDNEETPSKEDPIECNVGSKSEEPKPVKVEEPVKMEE